MRIMNGVRMKDISHGKPLTLCSYLTEVIGDLRAVTFI